MILDIFLKTNVFKILTEASSLFFIPVAGNCKVNKYAILSKYTVWFNAYEYFTDYRQRTVSQQTLVDLKKVLMHANG